MLADDPHTPRVAPAVVVASPCTPMPPLLNDRPYTPFATPAVAKDRHELISRETHKIRGPAGVGLGTRAGRGRFVLWEPVFVAVAAITVVLAGAVFSCVDRTNAEAGFPPSVSASAAFKA